MVIVTDEHTGETCSPGEGKVFGMKFDRDYTVQEFINDVIPILKECWGNITVRRGGTVVDAICYEWGTTIAHLMSPTQTMKVIPELSTVVRHLYKSRTRSDFNLEVK